MMNKLFVLFFILISIETIAQSHLINEEEWYLWQKDNIKIYVHEFGKGDTIIVLHGGYGAEHSYLLDFLIPLQNQFHFVLFDQRGALRSPVPDSLMKESITMDTYLKDLETLRKEMNLQEIDILAHSMGAHYAYHYLTVFPAHMGELTVISGFIPKWPDENEMLILQESQKERANFMQRQALSEKIKSIDNNPDLGPHKKKSYQWKIKYAAGQIYNLENWKKVKGGMTLFNQKINMLINPEKKREKFNFLESIEKHEHDINYIFGYHEFGDYGVRLHKHWLSGYENVKMEVIPEAGHTIWLDRPELFQNTLIRYLN